MLFTIGLSRSMPIFMEEFYQDTKEMVKITSGTLFDHWQVEVSVDFARIQYLFELRDTEG